MITIHHIALIVNPIPENEKAMRIALRVQAYLEQHSVPYTFFEGQWPEGFAGCTEVWVCGGDGTINWFINQFPDLRIPIALFAGGSGNDFHWMLYGNLTPEAQAGKVLASSAKWVDAGLCNDRLFLNGVGIGFDGAIVKDLLGRKKMAGKGTYLLSILKNIAGYHEKDFSIEMGSTLIEQSCFMISVANGKRYGGGFMVAPRADMNDGKLDVNVVGRIHPLKRIRFLPVIEKGEHLELSFIHYEQPDSVVIHCNEIVPAHIDGEYLPGRTFRIRILPARFSFLY